MCIVFKCDDFRIYMKGWAFPFYRMMLIPTR